MAKKLKPDVILMDIKLPQMNGVSATRIIRKECPQTNVLILSGYEDEAHITEAIQAGANGYLSKMLPASELVHALKTFNSEGVMIPQPIMGKLIQGLRQMGTPGYDSAPDSLTATEIKVMALLGKGKSNKEIAAELKLVEGTVKLHVTSILSKLGVADRTQAIVTAIKRGIVQIE